MSGASGQNNRASTIKYSGIGLSPGNNFTISGNQLTDIGADSQLGTNAYAIVASGPDGPPFGHVTISNNSVINALTGECYDAHGDPSIYFFPDRVGINAVAGDAVISDSKVDSTVIVLPTTSPSPVTVRAGVGSMRQTPG